MIDLLLVDDHPLLQIGLEQRLTSLDLTVAIGDIANRERLLDQAAVLRPTVVVLDHGLPTLGDGLTLIEPMTRIGSRVLMLTGTHDDVMWGACLAAGAAAVVSKAESFEDITDAILAVVADQPIRVQARSILLEALARSRAERKRSLEPFAGLTKRESVVLAYLVEGKSPATISDLEFVSIDTVRSQIKSIFRKLNVTSQLEAVAMANQADWLPGSVD